ncbi:MAG: hemerythrin domain-containing protein [Proteobacteria bacterium]|nr:hemerythrin domain-containing protein [Pseudomonadota bacterium]
MQKREFLRFQSSNLVYYTLLNESGDVYWEGVGKTLNVSMGGVLIEIDCQMEDVINTLFLEMALANNILKLKGRVAFVKETGAQRHELGIQFMDVSEQVQDDLSEFLKKYDEETGNARKLLREKDSNISNVVLTLSKEHKIINDYVIACRKILEGNDQEYTMKNLETLFDLMEKDLNAHFQFEEKILFQAALTGDYSQDISQLVDTFNHEHIVMREQIKEMICYLKELIENGNAIEKVSNEKVDSFMRLIKTHARNEMINLFPLIDADPGKIRALNKLMAGA